MLFIGLGILLGGNAMAQKSTVLNAFAKHNLDTKILDANIAKTPENLSFDVKVTSLVATKETVKEGSYDATKPEGQRWTLKSVDGKTPTAKEIDAFVKEHANAVKLNPSVDESTYRVESETPDKLSVSYKIDEASLPKESKFMKDCRITKDVNLRTKRLEKVSTINEKPVRIKIVNAEKLNVIANLSYRPDLGGYVPTDNEMIMVIKFLGQSVNMDTKTQFSNFRK